MPKTRPPKQYEVNELLTQWRGGDQTAIDDSYPLVYAQLRWLARSYMKRESKGPTLAYILHISEYTVNRDWNQARAWLCPQLGG